MHSVLRMIATIAFANTCITSHNYQLLFVVGTFKVQTTLLATVKYIIDMVNCVNCCHHVLHQSPEITHLLTGSSYFECYFPFILSLVITILISVPESLDILDTSDREYLSFLCHCCCCSVTSVVSTLCDTIDGSPPGSPVPGTLQARVLEWVAIAFSNA